MTVLVGTAVTVLAIYALIRLVERKVRGDQNDAEAAYWTDEARRADEVTRKEMGFKDDPFQWEARTPREKLLADAIRAQQAAFGIRGSSERRE